MALETVLFTFLLVKVLHTREGSMKLYIREINLWLLLLKSTKNVVTIFGNHFLVALCKFLNPKSIPYV